MKKGEPFFTASGNADHCNHCGNQYRDISKKKKVMDLPFDLVISLLGMYLKKSKTLIQKNINTPRFIAMVFTIAKI